MVHTSFGFLRRKRGKVFLQDMFYKVELEEAADKCYDYFEDKEEDHNYFCLPQQNRMDIVAL